MSHKRQVYHTNIWEEEAEADNPFATKAAYCHGYDVYGEILQKASWFEYLYLMFKGERPTADQAVLLEKLAIALANPGPREASVRAAMNGGVGGSRSAASLMAALSVGAGQYGGGQEIYVSMQYWTNCEYSMDKWVHQLLNPNENYREDIWLPFEHAPGFDPNGESCPATILQILQALTEVSPGECLTWLQNNRQALEEKVGYPIALTAVAAAAFHDLGLSPHEAVMLFHIFRLPGAAVHAIEQRKLGWKKFPFYGDSIELSDDPGSMGLPEIEGVDL